MPIYLLFYSFLFTHPSTTEIYTLSLHDALPISKSRTIHFPSLHCGAGRRRFYSDREIEPDRRARHPDQTIDRNKNRSEEHTSELQSPYDLVCRLLLEKKKKKKKKTN